MPKNFRERFIQEAGEHPYAWAASVGLPKDLVSAVMRGAEDYQPIRRTLQRLALATGKSAEWWLTGDEPTQPEPPLTAPSGLRVKAAPVAGTIVSGSNQVDLVKLELAMRALSEWELERNLVVNAERRPAVVALLYDYLVKAQAEGKGTEALDIVLRAIG